MLLLIVSHAYAQTDNLIQEKASKNSFIQRSSAEKVKPSFYLKSDSIKTSVRNFSDLDMSNWELIDSIRLDNVVVVAPLKFKDRDERVRYMRLERRTKKVWPYAVLAAERLDVMRERLEKIESKRERKHYTLVVQKYMENQFEEQLKKLTKSEGQILVKLMYRQTGQTTFETVREMRSGWNAFWYNVTANMFTISLKEVYDPLEVEEDYYIEHILRYNFQKNKLKYAAPGIDIDYPEIVKKWVE